MMDTIEENYVKKFYDSTAKEFSDTRYRPWTCVEQFMVNVEEGSSVADIGCGNGKNMNIKQGVHYFGCDFSESLVKICVTKGLNVIVGDILNIPYDNNSFNYTMSIAVIHHLSTNEKRIKAIKELLRITKPGGKVFILVWALEQEADSRRKFVEQENYVDWKDKQGRLLGKRYYYVFKENELESLLEGYTYTSFYEKGNWGIIIDKDS